MIFTDILVLRPCQARNKHLQLIWIFT